MHCGEIEGLIHGQTGYALGYEAVERIVPHRASVKLV